MFKLTLTFFLLLLVRKPRKSHHHQTINQNNNAYSYLYRDLKPANILLNADCHVRIADFGLCRSLSEDSTIPTSVLTDYVATRWYRAPEILLGSNQYSKSVDMWSVGCIVGEMYNRCPLFMGKSTYHQVPYYLTYILLTFLI